MSAANSSAFPLVNNAKWKSIENTPEDGNQELKKSPSSASNGGLQNGRLVQQFSASHPTRFLQTLAQENALKYGDEIRLFVRSNFLKKPKPAWMDPEHKGWTADELKGGYLGVYTKPDKTARILVPPLGEFAHGTFVESYYRVEDVFSGQESYGHTVTYGSVVVLVDDQGMVWNNKTGGLFLDGYLSPRPRGEPGEVFVSFQKNGKRGEPVQYGDVGVYIDVEDSHRFRVGFNNRLTNYKGTFSSVAGGYLNSDGSGDPLAFVVERYKGRIKPRPAAPELAISETSSIVASPTKSSSKTTSSHMASVSIINEGVRNTMRISPKYDSPIILYGLHEGGQVEIVLDNKSTVVLDGSDFLSSGESSKRVEVKNQLGGIDYLNLTWKTQPKSTFSPKVHQEKPPTNMAFVLAAVKLIVVYVVVLAVLLLVWSLFGEYIGSGPDQSSLSSHVSGARRGNASLVSPYPRGFKRARFFAIIICWLAGFVTPKAFFKARGPLGDSEEKPTGVNEEVAVLKVGFEQGAIVQVAPTPRNKSGGGEESRMPQGVKDGQNSSQGKTVEELQPWLAAGKDPVTGDPLHFAWVRFLNGERGNRETALKRWNITCEWRYENNIDGMLERSHRLFFLIKANYPHFYYGRSKYGNPVYIEQVGKVTTKNIRAGGGKLKDMIFHYIYTAEFMWNVLEPTEYGSSVTILDVDGIGFFDFAGEAVEFVKKATAVVQEHYPERGFMVFIINAPLWFTSIWAIVSTWVNPHTREKIKILGKQYTDELLKVIPRENLPSCYGGSNPRPLAESDEEKMLRNIAVRAMLKHGEVVPIGPDGKPMTKEQLEAKIDPSVDALMYKSKMSKVAPDGTLLCDEGGRPIEKKF